MSSYKIDKNFTDLVHEYVAIKEIYSKIHWKVQKINPAIMDNIDINNAVDYLFIDEKNNKIITVQERFRENKYSNFDDFTIRYMRNHNRNSERKFSEYFKMRADYFVYGIVNTTKQKIEQNSSFIKFAVIDITKLYKLIDDGKIIIKENMNSKSCVIDNNKLVCPIIENFDHSSSFVPFNIPLLLKLFPNENLILIQKGFLKQYQNIFN